MDMPIVHFALKQLADTFGGRPTSQRGHSVVPVEEAVKGLKEQKSDLTV